MKRRPAPSFSDYLQFVTTRTNRGLPLFRHPQLCREFLKALAELREGDSFQLFAYVVMPDHVHLLLRPVDGRVSSLMRKIKTLSARRVVEAMKGVGRTRLLSALRKPSPGRQRHTY